MRLTEVPLMGSMFLAMVWHAERARKAIDSEQRLRERQADFVRDASHELKTPITVARGHTELIREEAITPQVIADADVVLDELGRLSRVSERLLVLAAAEHHDFLRQGDIRVEPFLARTYVDGAVRPPEHGPSPRARTAGCGETSSGSSSSSTR